MDELTKGAKAILSAQLSKETGIDKTKCHKALMLNGYNKEKALEYLKKHNSDIVAKDTYGLNRGKHGRI